MFNAGLPSLFIWLLSLLVTFKSEYWTLESSLLFTFVIFTLIGYVIFQKKVRSNNPKLFSPDPVVIKFLITLIYGGFFLNIFYSGFLPFARMLDGVYSGYRNFGIQGIWGLVISLILVTSLLIGLRHQWSLKKRLILWMLISLPLILVISRLYFVIAFVFFYCGISCVQNSGLKAARIVWGSIFSLVVLLGLFRNISGGISDTVDISSLLQPVYNYFYFCVENFLLIVKKSYELETNYWIGFYPIFRFFDIPLLNFTTPLVNPGYTAGTLFRYFVISDGVFGSAIWWIFVILCATFFHYKTARKGGIAIVFHAFFSSVILFSWYDSLLFLTPLLFTPIFYFAIVLAQHILRSACRGSNAI